MGETPTHAATNSAPKAARRAAGQLPPRPVWAYLAFWFTVAYIPIHAYWALGGTFWLPGSALDPADAAAVRVANWGVCVLLAIGAVILWVLAQRDRGSRIHPVLLLGPMWIGAVVCASHAFYGLVTKSLYLAGVHGAVNFPRIDGVSAATAAADNHTSSVLDVAVFEPWFLIEGVLLTLAVWQWLRTPAGRRKWLIWIVAGVVVIDVFGTVLALNNLHFAVS